MEALSLPFMFGSMVAMWLAVEWTLRAQRRREEEQRKLESEARRQSSR